VDFTGIKALISHSRFASQRVKDAIVDQVRERTGERPSVDIQTPDIRINVHMHRDQVTVALDLSGDSLHRREYRRGQRGPAQGKPGGRRIDARGMAWLAAEGAAFVDPMCGSGTLLIEAAWLASDSAPGLLRTRFGFLRWRKHDAECWKNLVDEALERQEIGLGTLPPILGFDHDPAPWPWPEPTSAAPGWPAGSTLNNATWPRRARPRASSAVWSRPTRPTANGWPRTMNWCRCTCVWATASSAISAAGGR
jgi:23S rRNA G2445 N2-methylase RlmL